MEQMPSNMPVMESKPGPAGWLAVWIKAVTKPNEQTFIEISESPDATTRTALIWVFIAGTISGIIQAFLSTIHSALGTTPQIPIPGLQQFAPSGGSANPLVTLVMSLCLAPVAGLISALFFALGAAIIQWIAKLFGGTGTFEKLAYTIAAISVPITLVASVLSLLSAIPFIGLCFSVVTLILFLYALVLEIMAVKGVNRFGWGPAVGSVLIPAAVIGLSCCCLIFAGGALLGSTIDNIFSNLPGQ